MGIGRGQAGKNTRGSDGTWVKKYPGNITADAPQCHQCTWVHQGGRFRLKFANRACRKHGRLAG